MLKNLRVKTSPTNQEYKITGLSDRPCREQLYVSFLSFVISSYLNLGMIT